MDVHPGSWPWGASRFRPFGVIVSAALCVTALPDVPGCSLSGCLYPGVSRPRPQPARPPAGPNPRRPLSRPLLWQGARCLPRRGRLQPWGEAGACLPWLWVGCLPLAPRGIFPLRPRLAQGRREPAVTGAGQVRMQPVVPCTGREGRCISTPVTSSRHSGEERIKRMLFFGFVLVLHVGFLLLFRLIMPFLFREFVWWVLFSRKTRLLFTHFI